MWIALIWLSPFIGFFCYLIFGINRINRKIKILKNLTTLKDDCLGPNQEKDFFNPIEIDHLKIVEFGNRVNINPLLNGNDVQILNGEKQAYPEMLKCIANAKKSITLSSYIFNNDSTGLEFIRALKEASLKNVDVRVLIDATGAYYSFPTIIRTLKKEGIPHARFLPFKFPWPLTTINLRNHRKILVIDGEIAFTGGMNIKKTNLLETNRSLDLHFKFLGPVVAQIQKTFVEDWLFAKKELLEGPSFFPKLESKGDVYARGIVDGPDEFFEKIHMTLLGIISQAKKSIKVITPYFLPNPTLLSALEVASLKGIEIKFILPSKNNFPIVKWAGNESIRQLIKAGIFIYESPPPFDHSKLLIVDDSWALIGSTNWDARSLHLNFEFNVECYSADLAKRLNKIFEEKLKKCDPLLLNELQDQNLLLKLRDSLARLLTPIL